MLRKISLSTNRNLIRDDWSFMGAIGLHAKLSVNVISIISKISGSIQNHGASK